MLYLSRITDATVDAFATCGFNFRMRKYAQCGPRLRDIEYCAPTASHNSLSQEIPQGLERPFVAYACVYRGKMAKFNRSAS